MSKIDYYLTGQTSLAVLLTWIRGSGHKVVRFWTLKGKRYLLKKQRVKNSKTRLNVVKQKIEEIKKKIRGQ